MKPVVTEVPMPAASRALSTLPSIDYEDAFLVDVRLTPRQAPEQWARDFFAGAPAPMRTTLPRAWFALGLELGPTDSDRHVFGWDIRRSTSDHVLLGAGSRLGMPGELLFQRHEDGLLFATFLRHGNDATRVMWAGIGPVHRRVVRELLEHAAAGQASSARRSAAELPPGRL
jgi:hypothetical protein